MTNAMRLFVLLFCIALPAGTFLTGCGPSAPKVTSEDMKAFEAAPRELKETWSRAHAAAKTNDYASAILTLRSLLAQKLSVEQIEAVQDAIRAYNVKLVTAADRGDVAAQKGLETLRNSAPRTR